MFEFLSQYGMLDYHYWMWIAATLFVITVMRDMLDNRAWARRY